MPVPHATVAERLAGPPRRAGAARRAVRATLAAAVLLPVPAGAAITCSLSTAGVAFGVYDPGVATPLDTAGSVIVSCTHQPPPGGVTVSYGIALSAGSSGTPLARTLRAGPSALFYNLFRDASRTQVWGDGAAGTFTVAGSFALGPSAGTRTQSRTHAVHARLPAAQTVPPGAYSDTLVVTLTF